MDTRTPTQRSKIMRAVRQANTGPELLVRKALHGAGYRYRLHPRDIPGRPDIVMRGRKVAIFVHGCFWHSHNCLKGRPPKSKADYWLPKLRTNTERDARVTRLLTDAGWTVLTVWECETKDPAAVAARLSEQIGPTRFPDRRRLKPAL